MAFFKIDPTKVPSPPNPQPISAGVVMETCAEYVVPTGGNASGSVVKMIPLPARARVVETMLTSTAGITAAVGDGDDVDRYILSAALTANAVVRSNAATAFGYNYGDAGDTVDIVFGANVAAGAIIRLTALYVYE